MFGTAVGKNLTEGDFAALKNSATITALQNVSLACVATPPPPCTGEADDDAALRAQYGAGADCAAFARAGLCEPCVDTPGFSDAYGSCGMYAANKWCAPNGTQGSAWQASWGALETSVVGACCACGKGRARMTAELGASAANSPPDQSLPRPALCLLFIARPLTLF